MADVLNLDERRPHISGEAKCANCGHKWVAVALVGTSSLECPSCKTMQGMWIHPTLADKPLWQCSCGNEFFVIHTDRIMCSRCGKSQHGIWD